MRTFSSFREFIRLYEAEIPAPPGVDADYWNKEWFRNHWLSQNPDYLKQLQTQQGLGQKAVARALPKQMTLPDVESSIRDYMTTQGSKDFGYVKELNSNLQNAINQMIKVGTIVPEATSGKARMNGGGIHFYRSPIGLGFIVNARGIRPMSLPFGRTY